MSGSGAENARVLGCTFIDMSDALVIPGRMYGSTAGMLMYVGDVAERRGARVHRHVWSQQPPSEFDARLEGWVRGEISGLVEAVGGRPLLIGKSLESLSDLEELVCTLCANSSGSFGLCDLGELERYSRCKSSCFRPGGVAGVERRGRGG